MSVEGIGYTAICAIAGIILIIFSLRQRHRLRESENWPQTMATVKEARVVRETSQDSAEYHVYVTYEFSVDGQRHTGKRIGFNRRGYMREKSAQAELARFPVGSSVPVYFNPAKPDDAVLQRTAPFNTLYLVLGLAMVVFTVAMIIAVNLRTGLGPHDR